MSWTGSARLAAGAFLMLAPPVAAGALKIAAKSADGACSTRSPFGIATIQAGEIPSPTLAGCVLVFPVPDLSDQVLGESAGSLARIPPAPAVLLEFRTPEADQTWRDRLPFAIKKLSSAIRSAAPAAQVVLAFSGCCDQADSLCCEGSVFDALAREDLAPYADAIALPGGPASPSGIPKKWLRVFPSAADRAASAVIRGLKGEAEAGHLGTVQGVVIPQGPPLSAEDQAALVRLAAYWTDDVSPDPTPTKAVLGDGRPLTVVRFFDAKRLNPILFLPAESSGRAEIGLSNEPHAAASVENLSNGARREFVLHGAKSLTLDLSKGPLAVVLHPAGRSGEARASVEVGAVRGLSAEEIVARERAWDAGQREGLKSFVADMKASLRFRIAEVNETFDLTIRGPFFFQRGEPGDWEWQEFYLNGVRWKGKTLPRLPILQPEKVTTLPLDIRLTEDYDYVLRGEGTVGGRRAYHILYTPKNAVGEKPIYRGSVWIDQETFALLRRESIQMNLKGETLSNIQNEYYQPVPAHPEFRLPLEIRGQQVFSTAGRTTAIERDVRMSRVEINLEDFATRRANAYASPGQMIRDTERGMRYLVPDPAKPGKRIVEENVSKKSTFGLLGAFYDDSLDYPLPLLGIQHFNFDLWGRGKQLSLFFGGALLTANYTDPSLAGSRFDLGADLFAVAFPFGDVAYRNGKEVSREKIKHLPAVFQVNLGRPLGPYLKSSLGLFTKWDNFQREKNTGPNFVTPVDTFTDGAELKLVGNVSGFSATASGSYFRRRKWEPWGDPATSEYDPRQKDYWKYSLSLSKDHYFRGFRKLHVSVSYLGGRDLDRFSKYEFGAFSGNPLRGFKSGSVRTQNALFADISYGLNIENVIRFEAFYDQAIVTDKISGFDRTYFSGAGLLASLNGPWQNSLLRAEVGVPVVAHGVRGFVVNVLLLKLF